MTEIGLKRAPAARPRVEYVSIAMLGQVLIRHWNATVAGSGSRSRAEGLGVASMLTVVFGILLWSPVTQVADSAYSLMLSHSLYHHASFTLERYFPPPTVHTPDGGLRTDFPRHMEISRSHLYYWYPPGSSILSVPFAALLELFGVTPVTSGGEYDSEGETRAEPIIASFLMTCLAGIVYATARLLLTPRWSALIGVGTVLGTQAWSSASRALWSHAWLIVLLALALYLIAANAIRGRPLRPVLLATLLSLAYWVRPTASIPIVLVTGYVLLWRRRDLIRLMLTGSVWLGLFVTYSWIHFRTLLPDYYRLGKAAGLSLVPASLAGHLFSPSRGLFIYVPVVLFILYLLLRYVRRLPCASLAALASLTVLLSLLSFSMWPMWWGGYSYGPRLLADLIPWLALLAVIAVRAWLDVSPRPSARRRIEAAAGIILLLVSIGMNGIGAISIPVQLWCPRYLPGEGPHDVLWDWRRAQFRAAFVWPFPEDYPFWTRGRTIDFRSAEVTPFLWYGWGGVEGDMRWTQGDRGGILFALDNRRMLALDAMLRPKTLSGNPPRQTVQVFLNDRQIDEIVLDSMDPHVYSVRLPARFLRQYNQLVLVLRGDPVADGSSPTHAPEMSAPALGVSWLKLRWS